MTGERREQLIDDYVRGRSAAGEIREIDALVRADPGFRAALVRAAHDEAVLQQLGGGHPAIGGSSRSTGPSWRRLVSAVAGLSALAAAAGWLLVSASHGTAAACRVVETRGSVLLLARGPGDRATPVAAGDVIAADRRIWTCPWAAVAVRLADGTRLQIDRGSEATIACGRRPRIDLIRGTAFVNRERGTPGSAVVKTSQAAIEVGHGLAAVVVDGDRTLVEVAEGETSLTTHRGGTTRIASGQVAVLQNDDAGGVQVQKGRLEWQLPDDAAAPTPAAGS